MAALKLAMAVDSANPNIGDLYLDNGSTRLTKTLAEEVQQLLFTRFRMFQGEWFLDVRLGLPWFQRILGLKVSNAVVAQIFRFVITTTPGVRALNSFALTNVARAYALTFDVSLADGATLRSSDFGPFLVP